MSWVDILKETITQGRVKEIEDIDIDIEDDDCLRWLNRLYDIISKEPRIHYYENNITDEETACKIKELWEDRSGRRFRNHDGDNFKTTKVRNRNHKNRISVTLSVALYKKNNTFDVELFCADYNSDKSKWVVVEDMSKEKVIKKVKELCNYLNISYNKLMEGVF